MVVSVTVVGTIVTDVWIVVVVNDWVSVRVTVSVATAVVVNTLVIVTVVRNGGRPGG